MRCWTSTNPAPIGVSQDCEEIPDCRVARADGFESAYHAGLSVFAIGQLESNSVPPYPVCDEQKCVSVAAADSSLLASDRTRLTFGDQCNAASTAGYTGSVSTLTCIFEVMNGSVSLMGGLANCSATVCAVTDFPSGMSHDWDGIAFGEYRCANCSDCHMPVDITSSTLSCGYTSFLDRDTMSFYSVCKVLSCPSSALVDDDTVEGLDCCSLTLGEACGVACADGHLQRETLTSQ